MMSKPLVIFGSAEMAELAKFYFTHDSERKVVAFTVDDAYIKDDQFNGLPLVPFSEMGKRYPAEAYDMHVALSYAKLNRLRQEKYEQAKAAGYTLASFLCSKSATWPDLAIGDNCFILENQTIQPTVRIGNNVIIWSGNHIGHNTNVGDHTYIASHVVISGHCNLGERNFLGVNASVRDFCKIGNDCFIGMGAIITQNIENGSVILAPKSEIFIESDRKAKLIKRAYFK
jgi:sugar O-acyltransferase (sialic acid O-acetyltransferase NeuD family)